MRARLGEALSAPGRHQRPSGATNCKATVRFTILLTTSSVTGTGKELFVGILVTGGAGFIGSHLIERLLQEGRPCVCLDNFDDFYPPDIKRANIEPFHTSPEFRLVEGDIRSPACLQQASKAMKITTIVHLAARAGVRPSILHPLLYHEVNITGTMHILEFARQEGITQLVFASSSSVYGNSDRIPFREDDPIDRPISPYAATKRAGELLCHTYSYLYGMHITCLRFFTVYGPRQRPEMAIHAFTRRIHAGEPIHIYGDGTSQRDYTFISDIIDGVMAALDRPQGYQLFNLGESRTVTLVDLIAYIEEALGKKALVQKLPEQPGDVRRTYADISKARRLLNYSPSVPIEKGIPLFVEWFLNMKQRDANKGQSSQHARLTV